MRRRQAYATDQYEQAAELVKEPETKKVEKLVKKGYCRKCGVRVGRGVYGHQQKCNGTP